MATIKTKGNFQFTTAPHLPSFRTVRGILDGTVVTVDFNKLEVSYNGAVLVWVNELNKFITHLQIEATDGEDPYFEFMSHELKKISNTRVDEVKRKKREQVKRKKQTAA